jgi:CRP/FNR family transcriptional regulator
MKKHSPTCDLESCFLCSGCEPGWRLAISTHKQNRRFKKGAQIFTEGMPVEGIFFIYSGKVKVHKKWGTHKDLIVRFAQKGDMIGYRGLGNELVYPISATALEDVIVCFMDLTFFDDTLRVNPRLSYELLKFYAKELQQAEERMRNLVHMEVKGRLADTILMLKSTFGLDNSGYINITLTKQDIASYAGTTYETLSRIMNELVKENIVKISGKRIAIQDESQLRELFTHI